MNCWKCARVVSEGPVKVGFRDVCPHCGIDLHTCTNCHYYAPGKPNDCAVPGTDFVRDREAANFCEEFKPRRGASPTQKPAKGKFNDLFKND